MSERVTPNQAHHFLHSSRVWTTLQFVRTLIARQALIDELETGSTPLKEETSSATSEACRLSVDTVKTYSHLRHLGFLRFCGFDAVSHVTAAAHTLIACMFRSSSLAFEYRPDLLTAIDVLLVFSSPFPYVKAVAQQLGQLSRTLDYKHGSNTQSEAVAIRILARRMARSSSNIESTLSTQCKIPTISIGAASCAFLLGLEPNTVLFFLFFHTLLLRIIWRCFTLFRLRRFSNTAIYGHRIDRPVGVRVPEATSRGNLRSSLTPSRRTSLARSTTSYLP